MLDSIKLALRISHNYLDDEITAVIAEARAEMIRSGISSEMAASETDPLILAAIKAYCLMRFASDTKMTDGYEKSWLYQLDCLRKSDGYH